MNHLAAVLIALALLAAGIGIAAWRRGQRAPVPRCAMCGSTLCHGGLSCPRWPKGWGGGL